MAFSSRVSYTGSTSTGPYSFSSISLFADSIVPLQSQVVVTISGATQVYTASAPAAGEYSMDKLLSTITLGSAPASADVVKIRRDTSSTAYVDFTNNSPLTAADLDIATQQSLFLAEEGVESIESGDAVLALPELTDADSTMAPANGDFLRWNESDGQWVAQAYVADGTGPDVNIVTDFPASPAAGDLIYHSTYGATFIYDGSSWQYMCGTGAVISPDAGTTVAELTFGAEGRLDGLTLPSNWTPLMMSAADPGHIGHTGSTGGFWAASPSDTSSNYDRAPAAGCAFDFRKAFYATGVTNTSGALGFTDATFDAETTARFPNANSATTWWGGTSESNSAIDATAVLMPRWSKTDIDPDTGFTSESTNNNYRSILWHYPAGIAWGSQSWRTTSTFLQVRPGYNGNNTDTAAGQSWAPTQSPYWDPTPGTLSIENTNDVNGLLAACNNDRDDVDSSIGRGFGVGIACPTSSATISMAALVPGPHIGPSTRMDEWSENGANFGPQMPTPTSYLPYVALANAGQTTSSSYNQGSANGIISDKAIVWRLINQWDADAKVLTSSVVVDSVAPYNAGGQGSDTNLVISTDVANGDSVKAILDRQSSDFFFSHGSAGGSMASYSTGNAPAGLVSIKIETL